MTFIGKLFVMLNLALSLLMAGLAFGLYMTGIDWSDNPAKQGRPEGQSLVLRKKLEKELGQLGFRSVLKGADSPQGVARSWEAARISFAQAEDLRTKYRPEYATRLQRLLSGPGAIQEVVLKNHLPEFDPRSGFLVMTDAKHNGKPLASRSTYFKDIALQRGESFDLDGKLTKQYKEDVSHTNAIIGDKDKMGSTSGLLFLLARDREKRQGLIEELTLIEGQDVNTKIDAAAVQRSYQSVKDRIEELERFLGRRGVAFTPWKQKAAKKD